MDVPVISSLDRRAELLSALAMTAVFKFKTGMLTTLAGAALAGMVLSALPA